MERVSRLALYSYMCISISLASPTVLFAYKCVFLAILRTNDSDRLKEALLVSKQYKQSFSITYWVSPALRTRTYHKATLECWVEQFHLCFAHTYLSVRKPEPKQHRMVVGDKLPASMYGNEMMLLMVNRKSDGILSFLGRNWMSQTIVVHVQLGWGTVSFSAEWKFYLGFSILTKLQSHIWE